MKSACMFAALALFAFACTTTTTTTTAPDPTAEQKPTDPGTSAETADPAKTADAGSASSSGDGGNTAPTPGAPACSDTTDEQSCITCCAKEHPQGAQVYMGAVLECICEESTCATECASTLCAAKPVGADATCNDCFGKKSQSCGSAVLKACSASADCKAFSQCTEKADCSNR